jgi:hypothetical protein
MNFHLQFPIKPFSEKINYKQKMLFVGSCFAENIGELMQEQKYNAMLNPHGILYNPISLSHAINSYIENKKQNENDLFFASELWNSWEHHSRYSNSNKQDCLNGINTEIQQAHVQLKNAEWLFVTFGSAYVYKHVERGAYVGNCHKIAQKYFEKKLLSADEIVKEYTKLLERLKKNNPSLKIIFTVSPVRYIRDGMVENNLSKAHLLSAVHELVNKHSNCFYFPAYELVMDDLRDYRFYKSDLVHPNEQAIEYVFEKFRESIFDDETNLLYAEIKNIINAKKHRPVNEQAEAHKKFKSNILTICAHLSKEHPYIDFTDELLFFS